LAKTADKSILLDIFKNSNDSLNKVFKLVSESILPRSLYAKSSTSGRSSYCRFEDFEECAGIKGIAIKGES
jgi:hypothetical protein